jgi:hypothetical protein
LDCCVVSQKIIIPSRPFHTIAMVVFQIFIDNWNQHHAGVIVFSPCFPIFCNYKAAPARTQMHALSNIYFMIMEVDYGFPQRRSNGISAESKLGPLDFENRLRK